MRLAKEEPSMAEQVIDLISAVKELHGLSCQELNKLLRDSENFTIRSHSEKGSTIKIDVEKLAGFLPLHLIAVLMSSDRDESLLRYLLCGIRLLHSLCDLAPRNSKLEQVLLDDVKVSEQLLDLVFYLLIVLSGYRQENRISCSLLLVHSALVASSLHLLSGCISLQWQDLVQVLLAHPKVDIFMDAAFGAVHVAIRFLQVKLSDQYTGLHVKSPTAEQIVNYICQQCEASLQILLSLCQQKVFRERLLRNKELCGRGGVLSLAQAILNLNVTPPFVDSFTVVAAISRLKAKVLSILLHLCEAESISYLDEVASSPGSLDLAKSVVLEVLLDDVKVSEQLLDLVFYLLIVLSGYRQENRISCSLLLVHSALVASSLHLLSGCISLQWQDLVQVLLAHPKVDIFMDAAFGAVHVAIRFLQVKLSDQYTGLHVKSPTAEQIVNYICQQCEASLQILLSLCQQKVFRERLLRNKELCGRGGVLSLAQAILNLNVTPPFVDSFTVVAAISRLKAKVLSIKAFLTLDEVASSPGSLDLAKSVVLEILELLKAALSKDPNYSCPCSDKTFPMGLLRLNAMRLADIFSDDSNFRSFITTCFTKVMTAIFSLPHGDFLSIWCSSEFPPREEDATLEYDTFAAAGWFLDTFAAANLSNAINLEITLLPSNMPQAMYAHQRTSLFVKLIANLHCFVPNICEEQERNLFLHKFLECMRMDPSKSLPGFSFTSGAQRAVTVCRNLRSLLSHAESLIPNFLNEDDVQLLRVFFNQLQSLINPADFEENKVQEIKSERSVSLDKFSRLSIDEHLQEAQSTRASSSPMMRKEPSSFNNRTDIQKEEMSENSAIQEDEKHSFRNEHVNQANVMRGDKAKFGACASDVLREMDRDSHNVETSGSDTSSTRGKSFVGQVVNGDLLKSSAHMKGSGCQGVHNGEKSESLHFEEKQPRKRKRTIMNDYQIALMEKALLDEPEMQRNAAALQSWSDKLSLNGSEVTPSQLKNWLNNRKARLARAGKDVRAPMEVDVTFPENQVGQALQHESPESPGEDNITSSVRGLQNTSEIGVFEDPEAGIGLSDFVDIGAS